MNWKDIRHFTPAEFACPCCGACEMDEDFVRRLDAARHKHGSALVVTSGYRCARHNAKVGGSPDSAHMKGLAADLAVVSSAARYALLPILLRSFSRVGVGRTFVHVDVCMDKPQNVIWVYK